MSETLPDQDTLKQPLDYDPETGKLYWKARPREMFSSDRAWKSWNVRFAGASALTSNHNGYLRGAVDGVNHFAHRVIWKLVFGYEPDQIDHVNGVRSDNTLSNLREVDQLTNMKNKKVYQNNNSGTGGVSWQKCNSRWTVNIGGRYVGNFVDFDVAVAARKQAELDLDYHLNHGRSA